MILIVVILLTYSHISCITCNLISDDPVLIKMKTNPTKGAIVDEYRSELLMIKLTSPMDVIKEKTKTIDFSAMNSNKATQLRNILGNLGKNFQSRFYDILSMYSQILPTNSPIEADNSKNHVMDLSHLTRTKRNPFRFLISLFRFVRPATKVARMAGNVGKFARGASRASRYSKFLKTIKWASVGLSVVAIPFDIAHAFGVFSPKYEELRRALDELQANREKDIEIVGNITLITLQLNDMIMDLRDDFSEVISNAQNLNEINLFGSVIFNSYITTLQSSLNLLLSGKLPQTLLSLDNQRLWIEKKVPSPLLASIGTISPHLTLKLVSVDPIRNIVTVKVDVPTTDTRFQLMNFIEWEPNLIIKGTCYSSPRKSFLLGVPLRSNTDEILRPLLFDPQSCQTDGFILCESDSILDFIPDLNINKLCTQDIKFKSGYRSKRQIQDDLYNDALMPMLDISESINNSLKSRRFDKPKSPRGEIVSLLNSINELKEENRIQRKQFKERWEAAEYKDRLNLILILAIPISFVILCFVIYIIYRCSVLPVINDRRARVLAAELKNLGTK